jgi:hypothetical protein
MGMSCGQVLVILLLFLLTLGAVSAGAYWVLTNPDLTGGPALPTALKVNTPVPPTRTQIVMPPTWTLTPSATPTDTPTPTLTPTETETPVPASETPTGSPSP